LRRILLAMVAALVAVMVLVPTAQAQDLVPGDDDPMTPEDAVAVSHEELARIAGQPLPETGGPGFGGAAVVLPATAALILSSGVLTYGILRKQRKGGSA
jgi:hypothetical protein